MAKSKITIIGLGTVGTSLGAALRQEPGNFVVVGHDREPERAAAARKLGAVDRTEWNLHAAAEDAGLVILAVPGAELPELLRQIRDDVAEGAVILVLTEVMAPVLALGQEILDGRAHVVAGHPILTGLGMDLEPRADLLQGVPFCVAAGVETSPDALEVVNNLVARIGATPLYIDPAEHDGIVSLVEHLPRLLGAALMRLSAQSSGWADGRKLAGPSFARSTDIGDSVEKLMGTLYGNRANLLARLDQLLAVLAEWRHWLETEDEEALRAALTHAVTDRQRWEAEVRSQEWGEGVPSGEEPSQPGLLRQMFLGDLFRGRRGGNDAPRER